MGTCNFAYVGAKTPGRTDPYFFLVVYVRDVIKWFKFGDDRFRGLALAEGQILPFPLTLTVVLVNVSPEVDYP